MNSDFRLDQLLYGLLIAALLAFGHAQWWNSGLSQRIEWMAMDLMYQVRGQEPLEPNITIIEVDDHTLPRKNIWKKNTIFS